jgi:hypothetical protein
MDWKGCEGKRSWPNLSYDPTVSLESDSGKPGEISISIAGLRAKIWTQDVPDKEQEL